MHNLELHHSDGQDYSWVKFFIINNLNFDLYSKVKCLSIKNVWRSSNWFKSERNQLNQAQSKQPWQGRRVHVSLIQLKGLPMSRFTVDIGVTTNKPQTLQIFSKLNKLSTHFLFYLFWLTFLLLNSSVISFIIKQF